MREIKFRAWDKESKTMWLWHKFRACFINEKSGEMPFDNFYNTDEIVIQQYIGLKDKNGVEIYAGDIVKYNGNNWYIKYMHPNSKDSSAGYYAVLNEITFYCFSKTMEKIEIIGNIHEDKHLIKMCERKWN